MSFLGKVYKYERDENHDAFIKSLGLSEDRVKLVSDFKPSFKLEQNGDEYTLSIIHPSITKKMNFKNDVQFDEEIEEGVIAKNTIIVSGNVLSQAQYIGDHVFYYKMEFSDNELIQTTTTSFWDGTSQRYYKA